MAGFSPSTYAICNKNIKSASTGISSMSIDSTGHLIITYKDGTTQDVGEIPSIKFEIVSALPTTGIDSNTIYCVPSTNADGSDIYIEYIYINSTWERLGTRDSSFEIISDPNVIADKTDIGDIF